MALIAGLATWWYRRNQGAPARETTLRAWVDTLMPAEPDFPGALALGAVTKLAQAIGRSPAYGRLARETQGWMNDQARAIGASSFAALSENERHAIVEAAAASARGSAPRTFFEASWDDLVLHVYADPRAWKGLGYTGPPQPLGFLDHASAPKTGP